MDENCLLKSLTVMIPYKKETVARSPQNFVIPLNGVLKTMNALLHTQKVLNFSSSHVLHCVRSVVVVIFVAIHEKGVACDQNAKN